MQITAFDPNQPSSEHLRLHTKQHHIAIAVHAEKLENAK